MFIRGKIYGRAGVWPATAPEIVEINPETRRNNEFPRFPVCFCVCRNRFVQLAAGRAMLDQALSWHSICSLKQPNSNAILFMMPFQMNFRPSSISRRFARAAGSVLSSLIAVLILVGLGQTEAATIQATDCSQAAVQTACSVASPGDTVMVPAGTASWTSRLTIAQNIQLIGAGMGQTTIIDENPNRYAGGGMLIEWYPVPPSGLCRLSGFTFRGSLANCGSVQANEIELNGTNDMFRVDDCQFLYMHGQSLWCAQSICGVIDHCQFYNTNYLDYIYFENGALGGYGAGNSQGYGDVSWATPNYWGQTNWYIYVENCGFTFTNANQTQPTWAICDAGVGSRFVFRYNQCTNMWLYTHGTDSSGRNRGFRAAEVYMNNFSVPSTTISARR